MLNGKLLPRILADYCTLEEDFPRAKYGIESAKRIRYVRFLDIKMGPVIH